MFKRVRSAFIVLGFVGLIALNVATVTVQGVAAGVAGIVSAVAGASAVLPSFRPVNYRGKPTQIRAAVSDTTKRVTTRTARGASRNLSSVFAESLPVAGVAAIVGVTAWELRDACETMKDMHALELALDPATAAPNDVETVCGKQVPTTDEVWQTVKSSPADAWETAKNYVPELPEWDGPNIPAVRMPDITMPELNMPDIQKPEFSMPEFRMPELSVPDVKLPEVGMPEMDWKFWD